MKKILAVLLLVPGLALGGDFDKAPARETRIAYARLPGGSYVLRSMPLFDVVGSGGVVGGSGGGGGTSTFLDTNFTLQDDGDTTKMARFQLSTIATGVTRTYTLPNASGTFFTDATQNVQGVGSIYFGAANNQNNAVGWSTAQTPDTAMLTTGSLANNWLIVEGADAGFDFAHAQATDPTLFIHSRNQNTTEWVGLFSNGTDGIVSSGTSKFSFGQSSGNHFFSFDGNSAPSTFTARSTARMGWVSSSTNSAGSPDAFLTREGAAIIQMGADVNGAAITQTLKAADGITGTDIIGSGLTLASGLGTGAAVSQPATINRQVTKASGTTAQTYSPAVIVCPTKILSNTSATAQTIATITTTSTTGGNVTYDYTVIANNGTLQDVDSGMVKVSWNNNAGTVAAAMTAVILQSDSDASGTLAATPTATVATNVVSVKLTPTWVTIVPTTVTGWATFTLATSGDTVSCQ